MLLTKKFILIVLLFFTNKSFLFAMEQNQEKAKTPFDSYYYDITWIIFEFLPTKDILNLKTVSHLTKDLANFYSEKIQTNRIFDITIKAASFVNDPNFEDFIKKSSHGFSLTIKNITYLHEPEEILEELAKQNWAKEKLLKFNHVLSAAIIRTINQFTNLESLELWPICSYYTQGTKLPSNKKLELRKLKKLSLEHFTQLPEKDLKKILLNKDIEELKLIDCDIINEDNFDNFEKLRILVIKSEKSVLTAGKS